MRGDELWMMRGDEGREHDARWIMDRRMKVLQSKHVLEQLDLSFSSLEQVSIHSFLNGIPTIPTQRRKEGKKEDERAAGG
jgi:hypothetical protein